MSFPIEDNIPIPEIHGGKRRKYPVLDLGINQSFLVPMDNPRDCELSNQIRSHCLMLARRAKITLKTRIMPDGLRVWRVG